MAESLLERASRFIDESEYGGVQANNPTDGSFHELADDLGLVCAFSHVWTVGTPEGLAVFDTSLAPFGAMAVERIRAWRPTPFSHIVYTHGHVDHVGGTGAFLADAERSGSPRPVVLGHENVPVRFDRYRMTNGYNKVINERQFGPNGLGFPEDFVVPDRTFADVDVLDVGGLRIELHHDRGETDDHAWAWIPERRTVLCGDLFIWVLPNAGNPQKVQRFAADWAVALRRMAALEPELLCPAHGLPIEGRDRIAQVLDTTASLLEHLVGETLSRMNDGQTLDRILHEVQVPERYLDVPYLQPTYDEAEFVVRNVWRLYGGWYDGNPARLKPPADLAVAAEVAGLSGGALPLAVRAVEVAEAGDLRLACQLVEWAADAAPDDVAVHGHRAEVYRLRREAETSLMAKGIFGSARQRSLDVTGEDGR